MALLNVPQFVGLPAFLPFGTGFPTTTAYTLDSAGERVAFVAPVHWNDSSLTTRNIARIHFRVVTVTSAQNLRVSIQDLDASGDPDGVADQFRTVTPVANTGIRTSLITSDGTDTGSLRSVTRGQRLAFVIEFSAATGNLQIGVRYSAGANFGDVYEDDFVAAWVKLNSGNSLLTFAIEFEDGGVACIPGVLPLVGGSGTANAIVNQITFSSGSNPAERGNIWTPEFSGTVVGLWAFVDYDNACDLVLYDNSSNALATAAVPGSAIRVVNTAGLIMLPVTPVDVVAGTLYRAAVKPGASSVVIARYTATANAALGGLYSIGYYGTSRPSAGSWTDVNTDYYACGPIVANITAGAGGRLIGPGGLIS